MQDDELIVEDSENYNSIGKNYGFKEICLEQYRRCCVEGSKEMLRGGTTTKIIKGHPISIEIPNQREIFIHSVTMMHILLMPKILQNKTINEQIKEVDDTQKQLDQDYNKWYEQLKKDYKNNKKIDFNRELDRVQNEYELQSVKTSREKMVALSLLLDQLNYFEEGSAVFKL